MQSSRSAHEDRFIQVLDSKRNPKPQTPIPNSQSPIPKPQALNRHSEALADCDHALTLDPEYTKVVVVVVMMAVVVVVVMVVVVMMMMMMAVVVVVVQPFCVGCDAAQRLLEGGLSA
jgi:hypothetical protein